MVKSLRERVVGEDRATTRYLAATSSAESPQEEQRASRNGSKEQVLSREPFGRCRQGVASTETT